MEDLLKAIDEFDRWLKSQLEYEPMDWPHAKAIQDEWYKILIRNNLGHLIVQGKKNEIR